MRKKHSWLENLLTALDAVIERREAGGYEG